VQPLPLNDKTVICLSSSGNVISSKSEFYDWTYPPRRKPQVNEERREIKLKATFAIAILLAFSLAGCASLTNRMGDVETVSLVNTSSPVSVRTAFIEDAADKSAAPKQLDSLFEIDIAPQNTFGYLAVPDISQIESVDLPTKDATLWNRLANDQLNFYSKDSLMTLGVVLVPERSQPTQISIAKSKGIFNHRFKGHPVVNGLTICMQTRNSAMESIPCRLWGRLAWQMQRTFAEDRKAATGMTT